MIKSGTTSGQLDIGQPLGQADLWADVPTQERHLLAEEWYYFRSA